MDLFVLMTSLWYWWFNMYSFCLNIFLLCASSQVFRSKVDCDPGSPVHQPRSGSASPLHHGAATLGRNACSKVDCLNQLSSLELWPKILFNNTFFYYHLLPVAQQSPLLVANSTGSLPRNLAATLQDIETKRQLALQQKGEWPGLYQSSVCGKISSHCSVWTTECHKATQRLWHLGLTTGHNQRFWANLWNNTACSLRLDLMRIATTYFRPKQGFFF